MGLKVVSEEGGVMVIVPSSSSSSLPWFVTQGAGSSTTIDGKLSLLYFGGLVLRLGFSESVVCLDETQQRLDRNPIADFGTCVRRGWEMCAERN